MATQSEKASPGPVAVVSNEAGRGGIVIVCEHAHHFIPEAFGSLGLAEPLLKSHIAWDPGALETAQFLSELLDAPLVASQVSRLVYDCNRPPESPQAMPSRSEFHDIPGNRSLSAVEREHRIATYCRPFETTVARTIDRQAVAPVLVTIHSFTPVFEGLRRDVEIGILHDADARLADEILKIAGGYNIRRNQPYGPDDEVTHTLKRHALPRGLLNVMIEIRNDLVQTPEACAAIAGTLSGWLRQALARLMTAPGTTVTG